MAHASQGYRGPSRNRSCRRPRLGGRAASRLRRRQRRVLPHVFDRFYKASASRPRSEGSGLGLSIALENAHIHGGEITAANSPDSGAVFTLRLPRGTSPAEEQPAEDDLTPGSDTDRPQGEDMKGDAR